MTKNFPDNPFFSIITCTHNSGNFLGKNINSVKEQTFKDYEHIFIDGYSKDSTIDIIRWYRLHLPSNVELYKSKPLGISNAMNIGIKKSKGKYILFLHSDDSLYSKNVLKRIYSFLIDHPKFDWMYGKINVVEENGTSIGQFPNRKIYKIFPRYFMKFYDLTPHQAVFMKKSVFQKFGLFDESLSSGMDADLWLRILYKTNWIFLNEVVSNYMIRKESQSSGLKKKPENDINTFLVRKRHLNAIEMNIFKLVKYLTDRYNNTYR